MIRITLKNGESLIIEPKEGGTAEELRNIISDARAFAFTRLKNLGVENFDFSIDDIAHIEGIER